VGDGLGVDVMFAVGDGVGAGVGLGVSSCAEIVSVIIRNEDANMVTISIDIPLLMQTMIGS
jgi:hypothetical protein